MEWKTGVNLFLTSLSPGPPVSNLKQPTSKRAAAELLTGVNHVRHILVGLWRLSNNNKENVMNITSQLAGNRRKKTNTPTNHQQVYWRYSVFIIFVYSWHDNNNNNIYLPCTHQCPECWHDIYMNINTIFYTHVEQCPTNAIYLTY